MTLATTSIAVDRTEIEPVILKMLADTGLWDTWRDRTHEPFETLMTQVDAPEDMLQRVFTALARGPLKSGPSMHLNISWSDIGPEGAQVEVELPDGGFVTHAWHPMTFLLPDPQTPGLKYLVQMAETLIDQMRYSLELAQPLLAEQPALEESTTLLLETVRSADHVDISWIARDNRGRRVAESSHSIDPARAERAIRQIGEPS